MIVCIFSFLSSHEYFLIVGPYYYHWEKQEWPSAYIITYIHDRQHAQKGGGREADEVLKEGERKGLLGFEGGKRRYWGNRQDTLHVTKDRHEYMWYLLFFEGEASTRQQPSIEQKNKGQTVFSNFLFVYCNWQMYLYVYLHRGEKKILCCCSHFSWDYKFDQK